jgi:probable HAF family extracellular repeat protein
LESLGTGTGAFAVTNAAAAINDAGQVVGCSAMRLSLLNCEAAVMWSGGEIIRLGTSQLNATAINNRGQILFGFTAPVSVWDNGVMSELPGLSVATDINDRGEVLGMSNGRPVIWAHGMVTPLALPPGDWAVSIAAINNLGHAVGTITSTATGSLSMAVLWQNGEVIPLPALVANEPTSAADINNRDEIVGQSGSPPVSNLSGTQKAVLWVPRRAPTPPASSSNVVAAANQTETAPSPIDLGTLGGTYSTPTGLNDDGVVVGSSTTGAKEQHGFVWTQTNGMVDLGTFGNPSARVCACERALRPP